MPERYHLNAQDRDLVQAATILLKKAAAAETLRPAGIGKRRKTAARALQPSHE